MASKKQDLAGHLAAIPRGPGLRLSTSPPAPVAPLDKPEAPVSTLLAPQSSGSAETQNRTNAEIAKPLRASKGVSLRPDLHRALKHLALDEDRPLYELMDEALIEYLGKRGRLPGLLGSIGLEQDSRADAEI